MSFDCSICLIKDSLTSKHCATLSGCGHSYHVGCISKWAKISNTCPLCKTTFSSIVVVTGRLSLRKFCSLHSDANNCSSDSDYSSNDEVHEQLELDSKHANLATPLNRVEQIIAIQRSMLENYGGGTNSSHFEKTNTSVNRCDKSLNGAIEDLRNQCWADYRAATASGSQYMEEISSRQYPNTKRTRSNRGSGYTLANIRNWKASHQSPGHTQYLENAMDTQCASDSKAVISHKRPRRMHGYPSTVCEGNITINQSSQRHPSDSRVTHIQE